MPVIQCPLPDCDFETPDVSEALIVQLFTAHNTLHTTAAPTQARETVRAEKVKRPTISAAGSTEEWSYFLVRWQDYVNSTGISDQTAVIQLLECCEESLRKDVTRTAGGSLLNRPIQEVIGIIKPLAVREENVMVARVNLHNMRQDRDEPIRTFAARLKGQAGTCKFHIDCQSCNTQVNYTEPILRDSLIRGLADQDIQMEMLGNADQNMTLEQVLVFIERKETGKRTASALNESASTDATSSYKSLSRNKIKTSPPDSSDSDPCSFCGKSGHGKKATSRMRKVDCPAYGKECTKCKKLNHFASVCRSKQLSQIPDASSAAVTEDESTLFSQLCSTITSYSINSAITLDHHHYDQLSKTWIKAVSDPQPFIKLTISVSEEDYSIFGYKLQGQPRSAVVSVMADTGCQSCLIGVKVIERLNVPNSDLIPVTMRIKAANNQGINILGAIIVKFSGLSRNNKVETRQLAYVTDDSDKVFLSKLACVALGMIPVTFPEIGNVPMETTAALGDTPIPCNCPKRKLPPPLLKKLPFPATENNRERLQKFLLEYYKASTFNTCDHQPLPMMSGPPMKLMINPAADPVAVHTPVPVPLHWQESVKAGLDQDVRLGVIEPVPIGEPVTWCHRMVVCAKKNGNPRRTVDLQSLNAHALRETHHTPSPFHQARTVPHNKRKTVMDAWNGYHSVPIRKEDRHLTTFITPWGRYRYCSAPQGYVASGDAYTRRYDELVAHIQNKTKCIDDALLWADSISESFFQTMEWLDICGRHGITLNPEKFIFSAETTEFAGFEITLNSVRPSERYLVAIQEFPTPKNITDVRSWFGLVNQVAYAFSMAERMLPFRQLLKPGNNFYWDKKLDDLFALSKLHIVSEIQDGVKIFDKEKPTCLATDWSKTGIGFWLTQKHCQCTSERPFCCRLGWKTTLIGSRFTSSAESRYAPVEGEALAVADALDKTRYFVLGCKNLTVAVDHKPLLKLLSDRSLNNIPNSRLRNLKEKTLRYKFGILHIPGVKHKVADAASRNPTGPKLVKSLPLIDDIAKICIDASHSLPDLEANVRATSIAALQSIKSTTWNQVQIATTGNADLQDLMHLIESGIPSSKSEMPANLTEYHKFRENLHVVDGVVIYKDRILIPPKLRHTVLNALHSAHQGISSMTARAEQSVFWPGITHDISQIRLQCQRCNEMSPSQPAAPPYPQIYPAYPFQQVCADFFKYRGVSYLVIVDRYSNWPVIEVAKDGASGLIDSLRRVFVTYGIADELSSDGGPEFTATTCNFLQAWGVDHRLSSIAFPHSNCRAEIGVKTAKRLITDNTSVNGNLDIDSFHRAMLQYRNTPDKETKISPAMCLFGRQIRDFIPVPLGRYQPHSTWKETLLAREGALRNRHMKSAEYWTEHTRRLSPLKVGDQVRMQNQVGHYPRKWDKTGIVIEVRQFDQYAIKVDGSGRVTLRNRKFLRKYEPVQPHRPRITLPVTYNNHAPKLIPVPVAPFQDFIQTPRKFGTASQDQKTPPSTVTGTPTLPQDTPDESFHTPLQSDEQSPMPYTEVQLGEPSTPQQVARDPEPSSILMRRSDRQRRPPKYLQDYDLDTLNALIPWNDYSMNTFTGVG